MNATHCRHYNGLIGPGMRKDHQPCLIGLNVRDYSNPGNGRGIQLACTGHVGCVCPKFDGWTQAEVDADEKEMNEYIAKSMGARKAIADAMEEIGAKCGEGEIDCPACKSGRIHYSVSSYNGHVWAKCSTKDCVNFME